MSLMQMSFTGAVLIVLVLCIRLPAVNKLPKTTFLVLWGLVLIRLLLPFSAPAEFSVYSLVNNIAAAQETADVGAISRLLPLAGSGTVAAAGQSGALRQAADGVSALEFVYLAGAGLCVLAFGAAYILCFRRFSCSRPIENDFISGWLNEHQLRRRIRFRQCGGISSPLTYGIISPVILVPETTDWENTEELNYILLHELSHIRRFDFLFKCAAVLAVCVHWFNPLVWLMYFFFNRDMELSCDEFVVRRSGKTARADYARTLIALEEKRGSPLLLCSEFSMNISEERITAIMKTKPATMLRSLGSVALVLLLCAGFMTSAYTADAEGPAAGRTAETGISLTDGERDAAAPDVPEQIPAAGQDWLWPTESREISAEFGTHPSPRGTIFNDHITIRCKNGDAVYAAADGTVAETDFDTEYGFYAVIDGGDGVKTVYGHLETISAVEGTSVEAGEKIGTAGSSGMAAGDCLAFAVFSDGEALDPMVYY